MIHILQSAPRCLKHLAAFALITFGTTQCASTPDGRKTQAQGSAIGAGAGAIVGGLIGGRAGALWGAGIGGAGGFAYGTHVANKKAQYKTTEAWLDACIVEAESKHKAAIACNDKLDRRLGQLQREVRAAAAASDKAKMASLKREIATDRKDAQEQAAAFGKEAEMQRSAIKQAGGEGSSRLSSLRQSTSGIETQVSIMNKRVKHYAALESQTGL
jgi:hypothetical protein